MESWQRQKYLFMNEDLNGKLEFTYPNRTKYEGVWENGRKIKEGVIENSEMRIMVKIKEGQIHKCVRILDSNPSNCDSMLKFYLPNLKITKVGDHYKEEYLIEKINLID